MYHPSDGSPQGSTNFVHFDFSETGIPLGETTQVIITTATDIGKPVDTREAIRLVLHLLRALPFDEKRISTSEAWQKVKTKPVKTGEWKRVAPITCTLKESAAGAESVGLHPHAIRLLRRATQAPWAEAYEVDIPLETSRWEWFIYMAEITEGVDSDELDRETGLRREEVAGSWSGKEAG